MSATVAKTPLRASSMRACPRKAALEATVPEDRPWTDSERRIMFRGKSIGRDYLLMLAAGIEGGGLIYVDSGPDHWVPPTMLAPARRQAAFIAEMRVPWGFGVGHVDAYSTETNTVIEVLSSAYTTHAHSKLLQACTYGRSLPECEAICLAIVNPSDLSDERVIVVKGSPQWDDLDAEVEARLVQLQAWRDGDGMPARVCRKPSEARGLFCRHAETCFAGWEPEPLAEIVDPDAVDAAARVFAAKGREREVKAELKLVEEERKQAESQLATFVEAGKVQVGGFQVSCSPRRRESFKLALARQDSRFEPALLSEFSSTSEYTVFDVKREGAGSVEFGDDAPWTDADLGPAAF